MRKVAAAPVAAHSVIDEAAADENLKARLTTLVAGRSVIAAGSFHLVGIAEIRERMGLGWERVREKVHQETRRIIERHIARQDVYFSDGADDYVLVFATLGKNVAQLVCAKISQEVEQTLVGDSETREIRIRTVVSETDGALRIEKASLPDLVASAVAAATVVGRDDLVWADTPAAPAYRPRGSAAPQLAPAPILYRPVWDVKREVLSTYLSRLNPPRGGIQLDHEASLAGIAMLTNLYRDKFRLRLSLSVGFETIASGPRLRTYIELCRTIPEHIRKLVAFDLVNLPIGVSHGRLAELAVALSPFCGLVLATVDWRRADLSQFARTGIGLVNAVLPVDGDEKPIMAEMDRFARAATGAGLQSAIEGIGTSSLAFAAKAAGLDYISGDRISPCLEIPYHMLRFSWSELYFGEQPTG